MTSKDLNLSELHGLDKQIDILMECKPLPENEVKQLCEKVSLQYSINENSNFKFMSGQGNFNLRVKCSIS